jgi:type III secretion system YseE family protein
MNVLDENFDLVGSLAADHNGTVLKAVKDALENAKSSLKKQMDKGMSNDDFKVANALQVACQSAQTLVEQLWAARKQ